MEYRRLGRTGMDVSVVGLGAEHLVDKPYSQVEEVIGASVDNGINIMDVFMPQEQVRRDIGKALKGKRDKMIIQGHLGSTMKGDQGDICHELETARHYFEELYTTLDTDYIDLGMLFYIDSEADFKQTFDGGLADYMQDLKKKGRVRAIGASSHDPVMARRVVETGVVDMVMFSVNPAFDLLPVEKHVFDFLDKKLDSGMLVGMDPVRADFYRLCEREDVGITVMKALGAGKLVSPEHTPFKRPLTVGQCIHYALTRPAVASVLVGCVDAKQVEAAVDYLNQSGEQLDYSDAVSAFQRDFSGHCVYCNHCLPCPAEIDIAALTKFLDIARLDESNIPQSIRGHYGSLAHKGSECIQCGSCEERCPFSVKVMENMQKAAELFGE